MYREDLKRHLYPVIKNIDYGNKIEKDLLNTL